MRITFIQPTVDMSGGTRVVAIYAKLLAQMGHDVLVVSPPPKPVSLAGRARSWIKGRGWPKNLVSLPSHFDGSDVYHRTLDRWRPVGEDDVWDADVVIATWWETAEWVKRFAPPKGVKVYFIQGHEVFSYLPVERCRATYRLPFHKIVVSQCLKTVMSTHYSDNGVDVVPNSVDRTQFFAPIRGKQAIPTVGFLYSPGELKGVAVALEALRRVRRRVPELRSLSFGIHAPSPELGLPHGTEFFLLPPQAEIRLVYSRCDVWVTASRSEGFNLPALEAMACRTPVVATRTGWPEEAVKTGINGVLVDIDDVDGVANGIEWVLSRSDEQWRGLSSNAYSTSTVGSWQASARLFEEALERACRRAARGEVAGCCGASHRL